MSTISARQLHIDRIKHMLASSSTWQDVCVSDDMTGSYEDASTHIYTISAEPLPEPPFAVISPGNFSYSNLSTHGAFGVNGDVHITFIIPVSDDWTPAEKFSYFDDIIFRIEQDLIYNAQDGGIIIHSITTSEGPGEYEVEESRASGWEYTTYAETITLTVGAG